MTTRDYDVALDQHNRPNQENLLDQLRLYYAHDDMYRRGHDQHREQRDVVGGRIQRAMAQLWVNRA